MKKITLFTIVVVLVISLFACHGKNEEKAPRGNAVYFWKTSFSLSQIERNFLENNDIKTIYVKFFDIVKRGETIRPENTLLFSEPFPDNREIVPTVFIDSKAFNDAKIPDNFASLIVSRIDTMLLKNGYSSSKEIQIDFDWTQSNQKFYFKILSEIKEILHSQERILSTTIRLHQLALQPPPVDYGALMVYNTGNFSDINESNSILSTRNVEPYLKYLKNYQLPLVTALPIYSWNLLFRNDKFLVITKGINPNDTAWFKKIGNNIYRAKKYGYMATSGTRNIGEKIMQGDILRREEVQYEVLDSVALSLKNNRKGILNRVILYHLDEKSILQYNKNELKKIYSKYR